LQRDTNATTEADKERERFRLKADDIRREEMEIFALKQIAAEMHSEVCPFLSFFTGLD